MSLLRRFFRSIHLVGLVVFALAGAPASHASQAGCDLSWERWQATTKDLMFRFGEIIRNELDQSGHSLALISNTGISLSRFGQRYSHVGFSLKEAPGLPWSVRQLWNLCTERRPRLLDEGLAGFMLNSTDWKLQYVSLMLLPPDAEAQLKAVVGDDKLAARFLGDVYSASPYPFSTRYQHCNQWVAEMLAAAWDRSGVAAQSREQAQRWLKVQGYAGAEFKVDALDLIGGRLTIPMLHQDDHPPEAMQRLSFEVSSPASIETFVRSRLPGTQRIEFCRTDKYVVVRRGWESIAEGCVFEPSDTVFWFEDDPHDL